MNITAQERAERLFKQQVEKKAAMADYEAERQAVRDRTAKLRAQRLARENARKKAAD